MKFKITAFLCILFSFGKMNAQEVKKHLYKGTIDKYPITLYLIEEISGCPTTSYTGMYKYDNISKWLYLEISDDEENRLVMVEGGITGIISVKKTGGVLQGFWISPDGNKKLNVNVKEVPTNAKTFQSYDEKYDQVNYEMNDC
ncbi:hypothetical protein [Chryseobacterium polytrichastri]|uniref:Uncharacterized protein n=1 Tax=Chryseobacterium polytrichastri TaxID=1302687 RepID=A0A1M6PIH2_9FLAO|nr:hypothetical protein [Chryseobacterium polytrichastri]SHK07732.1 hypothetical protein SAMN05444267_100119 [Chryseobacterium polytrichastri]